MCVEGSMDRYGKVGILRAWEACMEPELIWFIACYTDVFHFFLQKNTAQLFGPELSSSNSIVSVQPPNAGHIWLKRWLPSPQNRYRTVLWFLSDIHIPPPLKKPVTHFMSIDGNPNLWNGLFSFKVRHMNQESATGGLKVALNKILSKNGLLF